MDEKFINIEKVIAGKNPTILKFIPRFIIKYLKRILHEDDVNAAINRNKEVYGLEFVNQILEEFGADIHVKGLENLPRDKRVVLTSNHPLGGLDGMAIMSVAGKVRSDIVFPVNDILMNLKNMNELFIPVNKHGRNSQNAALFEQTFASDKAILYFPAGLCSRKQKGEIKDLDWKKTVISKAKKHKRDIIPVHIDGRNSNWFYNLSSLRNALGIKANIEMLYLVDEMYKQNNKRIQITFAEPIPYQSFTKKYSDAEWASRLKMYVYDLGEGKNSKFEV